MVWWCINSGDSPDQLLVFSVLFEVVFETVAWDVWFLEEETSSERLVFSFNSLGLLLAPSAIQRVVFNERVRHGLGYGAEWFWGLGSSLKRGLMNCIRQSYWFFASNDLHKLWQKLLILFLDGISAVLDCLFVSAQGKLPFDFQFLIDLLALTWVGKRIPILFLTVLVYTHKFLLMHLSMTRDKTIVTYLLHWLTSYDSRVIPY